MSYIGGKLFAECFLAIQIIYHRVESRCQLPYLIFGLNCTVTIFFSSSTNKIFMGGRTPFKNVSRIIKILMAHSSARGNHRLLLGRAFRHDTRGNWTGTGSVHTRRCSLHRLFYRRMAGSTRIHPITRHATR